MWLSNKTIVDIKKKVSNNHKEIFPNVQLIIRNVLYTACIDSNTRTCLRKTLEYFLGKYYFYFRFLVKLKSR